MTAIFNALYGYIAAAILASLIVVSAVSYHYGAKGATAKLTAELASKDIAHREQVRALERNLAGAAARVSSAYEQGKRDAQATGAAVTAELRAGSLRLQERWAGCEAGVPGVTATPAELDAAARDREESAGRVVRAAAECDAQVRGLQELLIQARKQINANP